MKTRIQQFAIVSTAIREFGIDHGFTKRIFAYLKGDKSFSMGTLFDMLEVNMNDFVSSYEEDLANRWLDQGTKIGIEKGEKVWKANVLVRQLEERFSEVPEELRDRVNEASKKTLDAWLVSVLEAKDIESVFRHGQNS